MAHGDFRLDNLVFERGGVAVIDGQIAFRGRAAFDGMAVFRAWLQRRSAAIEDLDAGEPMPR